uniref:Histone acetyltransferase type B catalytic subunit n=1 Tax=Glossina austeni TaxID=7395 RepID=A0A1A9VNB3_GLOAU
MAQLQDLEEYISSALDVVEFKLIRSKSDLDNDALAFHPLMAHQIFGDAESIFGYLDLKVRIFYTAGPLHIYLDVKYEEKVDDLPNSVLKADNVIATIAEKLPDGCYFVNMDEFLKTLDKADIFKPFGEKLAEHVHFNPNNNEERIFEIYHCNYRQTPFLKFFSRLQTFVLWFIDAASYIDVDDAQWAFFLCYEKYKTDNGDWLYAVVGYTTVYEYYAYPQHIRPRVSQMLVLPPFQKLGVGTIFLETIYKYYQNQKNVLDITVEDPSDDFQRMRSFVDARLCMSLKSFGSNEIKKGFTKNMINEAKQFLKLNPRQCRKVYEVLRLLYTHIHDKADYTGYRLEVKKRLNATYHKQLSDIKKLERAKIDTQWLRSSLPNLKDRVERLHEEYILVEKNYMQIVEKLRLFQK